MSRKKFPNYNTISNNFDNNNDNDNDNNNNNLLDFILSKKKLITFILLLFLSIFFIFILTFNLINDNYNGGPIKSDDFLPSRTRNLTILSKLSEEIRLKKNIIFIGDV